jgi:hypothetical protein
LVRLSSRSCAAGRRPGRRACPRPPSGEILLAWTAERSNGPLQLRAVEGPAGLLRPQPGVRSGARLRSREDATSGGVVRSPMNARIHRSVTGAALARFRRSPTGARSAWFPRRHEPSSALGCGPGRMPGSWGVAHRRPASAGCVALRQRSCPHGRYAVPARRGRVSADLGQSPSTYSSLSTYSFPVASEPFSGLNLGPWEFRVPQPRQPASSICPTVSRQAKRAARPHRERPSSSMSGGVLLSHAVPRAVPSALKSLTSGFGMGPGVSPSL